MLSNSESIELQYLNALGYKYIGRHEKGTLAVFKEKPVRNISKTGAYSTWVIGSYPVQDHSLYGDIKLGNYDFVTWDNGVMRIEKLL